MSNRTDGRGVLPPRVAATVGAIRVDLVRLHAVWMGAVFDRGLREHYPVVEHRRPGPVREAVGYRLWAVLGLLPLLVAYPLYLAGLAVRFHARRLDRWSASLGVAGVIVVSVLAWGLLTLATYFAPVALEGLIAVAVAGKVATGSAVAALYATRRGGRRSTVALGYPFAVTALFLPPVVAALVSPTVAAVVFPRSESLAIWLLDNVLAVGGLAAFIRNAFELEGIAYVGMWFGLAVPVGWFLGGLVALAGAVRPADADGVDQWP